MERLHSATRLLCIIPISTTGMTDDLTRLYPSRPDVEITFIDGRDLAECPPCIENHEQALQSTKAVLPRAIDYINSNPVDAVLVCCFSDHPLVYALQEIFTIPVTGIFQAALQDGTEDGGRFGIVTTAQAWEPILTKSVDDLGFESKSAGVLATGLGVLELESLERGVVVERIASFARRLIDNGATSIILGCAGMAALESDIQKALPPDVATIDGVRSGIDILARLAQEKGRPEDVTWANDAKRHCAVQSKQLVGNLEHVY
ncbi:hydantoin racemase [Colletotrichum camelliae]|nr:hydantoin racemase [Colletotrichum camelliae]